MQVGKGRVSNPESSTDLIIELAPLYHRFAIWGRRWDSATRKIRLVDGFERPGVNRILKLRGPTIPKSLDTTSAMAMTSALSWTDITIMLTVMDFANAYRHIGPGRNSTKCSAIAFADPSGNVQIVRLNTQPFGPRRAPSNWARVTKFVAFIIRNVFPDLDRLVRRRFVLRRARVYNHFRFGSYKGNARPRARPR